MAFFSTTNILSLPSSILIYPRFLPFHHHCNPPLRLSLLHKLTFNLSYKNLKTIVSAVTSSYPTLSTGIITKPLIHKLSTAVVALSPQFQASLRISGPLFALICDCPAGYLNTPLTVVAAGLSKWFYIYSGVLMVRVLLSWFSNIPWDRQPLSAIRDLFDPYLNLFRNIIPPVFDSLLRCLLADGSYEILIFYGNL
ncbi:hypothetical protein N665_0867s0003 [Sinapis alba]|nr:hypothetical protein N665_0867s0003 [Sinapis alba]